jgi:PIN domain nuclease of toxin-antitoxin system
LNLLLDTHLLVWSAIRDKKLSKQASELIEDSDNTLWFSTASLWEAAIKAALRRPDFPIDVGNLRAALLANQFQELPVEGRHVVVFRDLPLIHKDPFDRLLVAQAQSEGILLVTVDGVLAQYGEMVRLVERGS